MKHALKLFLLVTATVAFAVAGQKPNSPQFVPVEVPGATATFVYGINNAGVMVGIYSVGQLQHGFASFGGKVLKIDVGPPATTSCTGVNSSNTVVGYYINPPGKNPASRGFLYENGTFVDIGPPGSASVAVGLNDLGEVVGEYTADFGKTNHGFLYDGTSYQTLDVPGADSTAAVGINNQGLILLQYAATGHNHAALYDGTNYTTIDIPGAYDNTPSGINNAGDVTYTWFDSQGGTHGAVLHAGQYHRFMVPNSNATYASGINDHGVIVGHYYDHTLTVTPGFKLIP